MTVIAIAVLYLLEVINRLSIVYDDSRKSYKMLNRATLVLSRPVDGVEVSKSLSLIIHLLPNRG